MKAKVYAAILFQKAFNNIYCVFVVFVQYVQTYVRLYVLTISKGILFLKKLNDYVCLIIPSFH